MDKPYKNACSLKDWTDEMWGKYVLEHLNSLEQLEKNPQVNILWRHIFKHVHPLKTTTFVKRSRLLHGLRINDSLLAAELPIKVDLANSKDLDNYLKSKKLLNEMKILKLEKSRIFEQIQAKKKLLEEKDVLVSKKSSEMSILYEKQFNLMNYCEKLKCLTKNISESLKACKMVINNSKETLVYSEINDLKEVLKTPLDTTLASLIENNYLKTVTCPSDVYTTLCNHQRSILTTLNDLSTVLFQSSPISLDLEPLFKRIIEVTTEIQQLKEGVSLIEKDVFSLRKDFSDHLIKHSGGDGYLVEESSLKWLEEEVRKVTPCVQLRVPSLPPVPCINSNGQTSWVKAVDKLCKELSNVHWKRISLDRILSISASLEKEVESISSYKGVQNSDALVTVKASEPDDMEISLKESFDETLAHLGCSSEQMNLQEVIKERLKERDMLKSIIDILVPSIEDVKSVDSVEIEDRCKQLKENVDQLKEILKRIYLNISPEEKNRYFLELIEYLSMLDNFMIDGLPASVWIQRLKNCLININTMKRNTN